MKLMVIFDNVGVQNSNIAMAILATGIPANVEQAQIDGDQGWVLLNVEDSDGKAFIHELTNEAKYPGVIVKIQKDAVSHNLTECVDCGLCISLCQKQVFSFDENWHLQIHSDRCVLCRRCVANCPQRALTLQK